MVEVTIIIVFNIMREKQTNTINLAISAIDSWFIFSFSLLLPFFHPGFYRWGNQGLRDLVIAPRPDS